MRVFKYDFVRAAAMSFVVAVHCLPSVALPNQRTNFTFLILQTLFLTGNVIFFMMSGKFNLRQRKDDNDLITFLLRKVREILVPFLVIGLLVTLLHPSPSPGTTGFLREYVKNISFQFNGTAYWFVFTLFGLLLASPFLAKIFCYISKLEKKVFVVLCLGFNLLFVVAANLGQQFAWFWPFAQWTFVFCLGSFVEDYEPKGKLFAFVSIAGVAAIVLTAILINHGVDRYMQDLSPIYIFAAIAVYFILLRLGEQIQSSGHVKLQAIISFVAKHSYTVYLCHMIVVDTLRPLLPAIPPNMAFVPFLLLFPAALVLAVALAFMLDVTLVSWAKRLYSVMIGRAHKLACE